MDLMQTCVSIDGKMDGGRFFPVGACDCTSAFDPGREMRPVGWGINACQFAVVHINIHGGILWQPGEIIHYPLEEFPMVDLAGCWSSDSIPFVHHDCWICQG